MNLPALPFLPFYQFPPAVNEPTGFTILPMLTAFGAPSGLYRHLVSHSMDLLVLPFLPVLAPMYVYTAN